MKLGYFLFAPLRESFYNILFISNFLFEPKMPE